MADNDNNNGFEPADALLEKAFKGASLQLNDVSGENGILTHAGPVTQSLLHRLISVDLDHPENELKTAYWGRNMDEADKFSDALQECEWMHMPIRPLLINLTARNAGPNRELVRLTLEGLTHTTYNINQRNKNRDSGKGKNSPLPS